MRKYFYFVAAIMALETAGVGYSSYMENIKAAQKNGTTESLCQTDADSLIQPQNHDLGIRHVTSVHSLD